MIHEDKFSSLWRKKVAIKVPVDAVYYRKIAHSGLLWMNRGGHLLNDVHVKEFSIKF